MNIDIFWEKVNKKTFEVNISNDGYKDVIEIDDLEEVILELTKNDKIRN